MKRNEEYIQYERGYRQAIRDKKLESFAPRTIILFILIILAFAHPIIPFLFLVLWTILDFIEWKNERKYGKDYKPPKEWEC